MKSLLRPWSLIIGCLLLLTIFAGCAPGASSSNTASEPNSPTETATTTAASTDLNGCQAENPPANASAKADVVVTFKGGAEGQEVTLNKGQTLEVRLPATMRWSEKTIGDASALTPSTGNGWYDSSLNNCVWRFTAAGQGSATLSFGGVMVCKPNTECPALAVAQEYNITVH